MARITRAKARQRALKGWKTRRARGFKGKLRASTTAETSEWRKYNAGQMLWDVTSAKEEWGDLPAKLAHREKGVRLHDWVENRTKQYDWIRPNGEVVRITGIDKHQMKNIKAGLEHVDSKLQRDIRLNTKIEMKHASPAIRLSMFGIGMGGLNYPNLEYAMKQTEQDYEAEHGRKMPKHERKQQEFMLKHIAGFKPGMSKTQLPPHLSDNPHWGKTGKDAAFLVHELGHAIDQGTFSDSRGFREAAKWKRNAGRATGFAAALDEDKKRGHKSGSYQGMSPSEDFAETFSKAVLGKALPKGSDVVYDKDRRKYFEKHVVSRKPQSIDETQFKRRWV